MKIGMLFPGYGSQFVGMAKDLYDESRLMQEYFEEAANCLNNNFVKLCFASSDAELGRMENAYPALFLVSASLAALLKQEGIEPQVVAGHSIGEFAALHHAGGISFPDGLYVLSKYAGLYQSFVNEGAFGGMEVSGLDNAQLTHACKQASDCEHSVFIAMSINPQTFYVMGHEPAIDALRVALGEQNITTKEMPIELGLHSTLMDAVVAHLGVYLEKVDFKPLAIPFIASSDARAIVHNDEGRAAVIKHVHAHLSWYDTLVQFADCDLIIEVGPGTSMREQVASLFPEKQYRAINNRADIEELKTLIANNSQIPDQVGTQE